MVFSGRNVFSPTAAHKRSKRLVKTERDIRNCRRKCESETRLQKPIQVGRVLWEGRLLHSLCCSLMCCLSLVCSSCSIISSTETAEAKKDWSVTRRRSVISSFSSILGSKEDFWTQIIRQQTSSKNLRGLSASKLLDPRQNSVLSSGRWHGIFWRATNYADFVFLTCTGPSGSMGGNRPLWLKSLPI